jgi:hypothetical protein
LKKKTEKNIIFQFLPILAVWVLGGVMTGWGWHLAQGEGGFGPGWGYAWMGWHLAQGEGGFGPGWGYGWMGAAFSL